MGKNPDNKPVKRNDDLRTLDSAIRTLYPTKTANEIKEIRSKVISYIAAGLIEGFDIAKVKQVDGKTIIRVLKLFNQKRNGRLLDKNNTDKEGK